MQEYLNDNFKINADAVNLSYILNMLVEQKNVYMRIDNTWKCVISCWESWLIHSKVYFDVFILYFNFYEKTIFFFKRMLSKILEIY